MYEAGEVVDIAEEGRADLVLFEIHIEFLFNKYDQVYDGNGVQPQAIVIKGDVIANIRNTDIGIEVVHYKPLQPAFYLINS